MSRRIYLDYAATAPLSARARAAFLEASALTGNPSSLHTEGRRARLSLESARETIAAQARAQPSELIFTASGTEADNLALKGLFWTRRAQDPARRRILLTGIEHHAILDTAEWLESHEGALLEIVRVDDDGRADLDSARALLAAHPGEFALGTLMWANNEMGAVQPVREFTALCADHGVPVHSDAVQAFGSIPTDFPASGLATMAVSGHKVGAPVGIGALFVRRDVTLEPHTHGGGQERNLRSGTLNVASAAAFAAALRSPEHRDRDAERLRSLQSRLIEGVLAAIPNAVLNGPDPRVHPDLRLPGNVNVSFPGAEGDSILFLLDMAGFQTSTGSACTAGVARPSHVILAMSGDDVRSRGTQRFSLGIDTTPEDVDQLLAILPGIVERASAAGISARASSFETATTRARRGPADTLTAAAETRSSKETSA
jgi:cysteine desulfurase